MILVTPQVASPGRVSCCVSRDRPQGAGPTWDLPHLRPPPGQEPIDEAAREPSRGEDRHVLSSGHSRHRPGRGGGEHGNSGKRGTSGEHVIHPGADAQHFAHDDGDERGENSERRSDGGREKSDAKPGCAHFQHRMARRRGAELIAHLQGAEGKQGGERRHHGEDEGRYGPEDTKESSDDHASPRGTGSRTATAFNIRRYRRRRFGRHRPARIEFWYEFASTYSYPTPMRIE